MLILKLFFVLQKANFKDKEKKNTCITFFFTSQRIISNTHVWAFKIYIKDNISSSQ